MPVFGNKFPFPFHGTFLRMRLTTGSFGTSKMTVTRRWPKLQHYADAVIAALDGRTLWCLGLSKHGHPLHPLYLRSDTELVLYRGGLYV
jgi:hypothetical protein